MDRWYIFPQIEKKYSKEVGDKKVWDDFMKIANKTSYKFNGRVVSQVNNISISYDNPLDVFKTYCILYMSMISEECKENTILGKRIKMLGVYNTVIDKYPIKYIVKYMRGKSVDYLKKLCVERGI